MADNSLPSRPPAPKAGVLSRIDPQRVRGELIQIGNRFPGARRDLDECDRELYRAELDREVAVDAERARIRRDLKEEVDALIVYVEWHDGKSMGANPPWVSAADLLAALDRICPEAEAATDRQEGKPCP